MKARARAITFLEGRKAHLTKKRLKSYELHQTNVRNASGESFIGPRHVIECITACYSCTEACNACADACLGEKNVSEMVQCIRDCTDCADVCLVTGRIMSRFTRTDFKLSGAQLRACIEACQVCGAMCEKHGAKMEHCRVCAEACRRCVKACEALLAE